MNEDLELLIKLNGYKVKLDSLNELKTLIGFIHDRHLSTDTTTEVLRSWAEKVRAIHPKIDMAIDDPEVDFKYFKPISESVASRWKAHTVDTQDSVLDEWGDAKYIRKITEQKIGAGTNEQNKESYNVLNDAFKRNLPKEYRGKTSQFTGDSEYHTKFLPKIQTQINAAIENILGDAQRLINYLHPVSINIEVEDTIFTISIESKDVEVNKIGDKKYVIASTIDDSILIPICDN